MKKAISVLFFAVILVASGSSLGGTSCKSMTKQQCTTNKSCSWVGSYKKKDGTKVKAYCRSKGKQSKSKSETKQTKNGKSKKDQKAKKSNK